VIGLGSPFLDWKLLVRGLLAYYAGDDGRALDNWSRLAPDRVPARLAAPLRFALDPAFRAAQPPKAHADLCRRADRLRGGLLPGLRALHGFLSGPHRLANAFRQAEMLLPALRRDWPAAVRRLAEAFRTAIIATGRPEDLDQYRQLFGAPPDDPKFERLEALALEERRKWHGAHQAWQKYERTLAQLSAWPAADRTRARALIWCRLGRNAAEYVEEGYFDRPRAFKPSAEQCLRRALDLAPDVRDAHEELFRFYCDRKKTDKAKAAGLALLERFPDHVPTLEALARLARRTGDAVAARDLLRRAVGVNPLDGRLRDRLADAHRDAARSLAKAGDIAAARAELDAGRALRDGRSDAAGFALAAVVAFKAGDADTAEELAGQSVATGPPGVAAYALLAEACRLGVPPKAKRHCAAPLTTLLADPPDARTAADLTAAFRDQVREGDNYVGRLSHESKIQKYVKAAIPPATAEGDLERLAAVLADVGWGRLLKLAAERGKRLAQYNPFFLYYEALGYNLYYASAEWKVGPLLDRARRLAEARPPDERTRTLLADIADLRDRAGALPIFQVFDHFFGGDEADDDRY
jgi:hypothetical protein